MTAATLYCKYTAELKSINRARQGNKYISLSNIRSADGKYIDKRYTFNSPCEAKIHEFEWTAKTRITKVDYRIWRKLLEKLCSDTNLVLNKAFG